MEGKKIQSIQVLRGIASVLVVLCHTSLTSFGSFGVDFFMVISGFVIMYSTRNKNKSFWMRRIIKIVPLYWFTTIITALFVYFFPQLFNSYEVSMEYLIKSLLFIPYEHSGIQQPILGLAWTLNYEMLFYVIFWVAMKINHRLRGQISIVICGVLVCIGALFSDIIMPFSYWTDSIILEFVLGILVYLWYENIIVKRVNAGRTNTTIRVVCMFIVVGIGSEVMHLFLVSDLPRFLTVGIAAALMLCYFLYNEEKIKWNKELVYLGNISYVLYLIHIYPVRIFERICRGVITSKGILAYMAIVIAIICAYVWNEHFEVKIQKALTKKIG